MAAEKTGKHAYRVMIENQAQKTHRVLDVVPHAGSLGQTIYIEAQKGDLYRLAELLGDEVGYAPESLKVARVGADLHITFADDTVADLVISRYYDVIPADSLGVVGQAFDGQVYSYLQWQQVYQGNVPTLADGMDPTLVGLGGNPISEPVGNAFAGLNVDPTIAAIGLLGLLGLAGGGGGGGSSGGGGSDAPTQTVTITGIDQDTGTSDHDFVTNDDNGLTVRATLSEALGENDKLKYSNDSGTNWTDISDSVNGTAVTHSDSNLTTTSTIKMKVVSSANIDGATVSQLITIDTDGSDSPNAAQTVSVSVTSISKDTGTAADDFITSDNTLVIRGGTKGFSTAGAASGDKVLVKITDANGDVVASALVDPDATSGEWTFDATQTEIDDGVYTLNASIVDAAGNEVKAGASRRLVIDTNGNNNPDPAVDPNANPDADPNADPNAADSVTVSVTSISEDTGTASDDFITSVNTLVISGSTTGFSTAGAAYGDKVLVKITDANGDVVASALVDPGENGVWTFDNRENAALADGVYTLNASIVDAAGNVVKAGDDQRLEIDTSGPTQGENGLSFPTINGGPIYEDSDEKTFDLLAATDSGSDHTGYSLYITKLLVDNEEILLADNATQIEEVGIIEGTTLKLNTSSDYFQDLAQDETRTISLEYVVTDAAGNVNATNHTADITVTGVNDALVLDLDSTTDGVNYNATWQAAPESIVSSNITITDVDAQASIASAKIVRENGADNDSWILEKTNSNLDIAISGSTITITTKSGAIATAGDYQDILKGINFHTDGQTSGERSFTVTVNDGMTNSATATTTIKVNSPNSTTAPITLDLDQDGSVSYTHVNMDVNRDGTMDRTAWVSPEDGVLVWDKFGDGSISSADQYAFTAFGGASDLAGLALGFDGNGDGVFDAKDAQFTAFGVWQDSNANGVADAGEVKSLGEWGITAIQLNSDGVSSAPAQGVQVAGQTTVTLADGSTMQADDAALSFAPLATSAQMDLFSESTVADPVDSPASSDANTADALAQAVTDLATAAAEALGADSAATLDAALASDIGSVDWNAVLTPEVMGQVDEALSALDQLDLSGFTLDPALTSLLDNWNSSADTAAVLTSLAADDALRQLIDQQLSTVALGAVV